MTEGPKEKLEYLEHEDVETMGKKTAQLRLEEAEKEKKRIAFLKIEGEKPEIQKENLSEVSPEIQRPSEFVPSPKFKKLPLSQKILIRLFYLFLFSVIISAVYWLLIK